MNALASPEVDWDEDSAGSPNETTVDAVLEMVNDLLAESTLPTATYRLQFNSSLTFRDARMLVPYLAAIGVSHCYASPFLKARAGSQHGYDIVDHTTFNPEIGTDSEFEEFVSELHDHEMGLILDVVPNHMAIATSDNAWWMDVLENGPSSPYAAFFDIDWMPLKPDLAHKVLLPVLGDQFGKVLEEGQLVLTFADGAFSVRYYDHRFPIATRSIGAILKHRLEELEQTLEAEHADLIEYQSILTAISHLPPRTETDPDKIAEGRRERDVIHRRLKTLLESSPQIADFVAENVRLFNGKPSDPRSFDLLDGLLLDQAYRLAFWRVAADEINYRRFFDNNELAAICMENPAVFERTHDLAMLMVRDGLVDGLRIDHPDGLYDPHDYFERLQRTRFLQLCRQVSSVCQEDDVLIAQSGDEFDEPDTLTRRASEGGRSSEPEIEDVRERSASLALRVSEDKSDHEAQEWDFIEPVLLTVREDQRIDEGNRSPLAQPLYLVVEKILGRNEQLPEEWPVRGTTGYDFLNALNGLFVDRNNAKAMDAIYSRFIREPTNFKDLVYRCKKLILDASMSSELSVLGHQLDRISELDRRARDFTLRSLTQALGEVIACFPVYRTYITDADVSEHDRRYVELAVARAKRKAPSVSESIFNFLHDILLLEEIDHSDEIIRAQQRRFVSRFQQFTSPIMAKAVEDTAFYIFNRLVSLNEVGGDPEAFGVSPGTFHQQNIQRQSHWPHSLLATSTHDTKRSEDVRARINVLSEIPQEWRTQAFRWSRINQRKKTEVDGELAPSRNDEYLLYQTLLGTWPIEPMSREQREQYVERIQQYMTKAMHEAKVHTSWISPHLPYESATRDFINALLDDSPRNTFLASFDPFAKRMADYGLWNSLSQTLLKLTCPGVPDIYQGTELWDFSLVDPDNRRPVDFTNRQRRLVSTIQWAATDGDREKVARELIATRYDGRIKMFVIRQVLNHRRSNPDLYATGNYLPLDPTGSRKDQLCTFARTSAEQTVIVVAPRLVTTLVVNSNDPPIGSDVWQDTWLPLPNETIGRRFLNVLTGETLEVSQQESNSGLSLSSVLNSFPVALLEKLNS